MNIYFDTEFTGLVDRTTLISLGMVAENNEKFYAEFTDYNQELVDRWVRENVIKYLWNTDKGNHSLMAWDPEYNKYSTTSYAHGDTLYIRNKLERWLCSFIHSDRDRIQLVSDVCHYDMYLFCNQIFGGAFNLPKYINPVCYDICQDLCAREGEKTQWPPDTESMWSAFNISREDVITLLGGELPEGKKHNSLYDAKIIKLIYELQRRKNERV